MPLIKDLKVVDNAEWQEITTAADAPAGSPCLMRLATWLEQTEAAREHGNIGLLLNSDSDCDALSAVALSAPFIAIEFPAFADGRGYSIATLLRSKYGYAGEIRAVGDVLIDQLWYMQRCGFTSMQLAPGQSIDDGLAALTQFQHVYQRATDRHTIINEERNPR